VSNENYSLLIDKVNKPHRPQGGAIIK